MSSKEALRKKILELVQQYGELDNKRQQFEENRTAIPPSGKVIGGNELKMMTDAVLDGWLTTGRFNDQFEAELANYIGVKYALTTSSGSSANLLAFTALTSPQLNDRQINQETK